MEVPNLRICDCLWNLLIIDIFFFILAWREEPTVTVVDTLAQSIEDVDFPTVTLCPQDPNSDRWGATIKVLDNLDWRCPSKR